MLTFRQIDDIPDSVNNIMAKAEQEIINDMSHRIARLEKITDATQYQMSRLEVIGAVEKNISRELSRALKMSEEQLIQLFDEAATRSLSVDDSIYRAAGYSPIPLADSLYMQQIIQSGLIRTRGEFFNLTQTTAATASRQFENALDLAHQKIVTGSQDYKSAIKGGIKLLTRNGLASVVYPTGWTDYMDVAFRRATLTGVSQTSGQLQEERAREMGQDIMELTAHPGARPLHAWWQSRLVSLSGQEGYLSLSDIGYGGVTGFKGANCRHDWFPYIVGISIPAYSLDKLREYNNKTVMYNGETMSIYDATQLQRKFERQIRRWKRENSAMDAANLQAYGSKSKVLYWQSVQRDFISQTNLTRDYFRERSGKQLVA